MSSAQFALADAVAAWIAGETFPYGSGTLQLAEAAVEFYPIDRAKDLEADEVRCVVFASGAEQARAGGRIVDEEVSVRVLITARCVFSTEPEKVRQLVDLIDAIKRRAWEVPRFADAPLERIEHAPLFDLAAAEAHVFKAFPTFVFPSDFEIGD